MAGSEFQSLEVIGIKELAKGAGSIFIQFDSEGLLSVRKPRASSKEGSRGARLNRHQDSICSTGKGHKWFFGEPGSRVS